MVGITCLASSPKHTEIYNKILQEWPTQSAVEGLTVDQVTEWIGSWQKSNNKNPEDLPTAKELVNYIDSDRVKSNKISFSQLGKSLSLSDDKRNQIANQLAKHLKSKWDKVHSKAEMDKFSIKDSDIQMMVKKTIRYITNKLSEEEKENIRKDLKKINHAGRTLLDRKNDWYLLDHSDKEGIENRNKSKGQEGFQCIFKIDVSDYTEEEKTELKNKIENGNFRNQNDVSRWTKEHLAKQGYHNSDSILAEIRESNDDNVGLHNETSQGESFRERSNSSSSEDFRTGWIKVPNADGINSSRYIPMNFFIQELRTSDGRTVIGFVYKEEIYLDETKLIPSAPIHEYTHIWDTILSQKNPDLWKKGIDLLKTFDNGSLWKQITEDENYGKKWENAGISGEKFENLIASEVHAKLVGENGEKLLDGIAKKQGQENIVAKLRQWLLDMWKELKATFSDWSQEELDNLTLADFNQMTLRDFVELTNFNEKTKPQSLSYKSALKVPDARALKFYSTFTPQQIKDRGAMIADMFSDRIDNFINSELERLDGILADEKATQEAKNEASELKTLYRDPIKGRQEAVKQKQVGVIISEIKQALKYNTNVSDAVLSKKYQDTIDFFEDLFNSQASLEIEEKEGIRIIDLKVADQTAAEEKQDTESEGNNETGHNTASGNDGWIFQVRYEDPFDSLSKRVKRLLYNIEREDTDDTGYQRKYPMGQIYASLLSYLSKNMKSPDDWVQIDRSYTGQDPDGIDITVDEYPHGYPRFPVLEQMRDKYPWVAQLIRRLTFDYANADTWTDFRYPPTYGAVVSQMYTNFRKAFIPYGKIQTGDGDYFGVTPLNYDMEERSQLDKLTANFNNGFTLTPLSIYNNDSSINREHAKQLSLEIKKLKDETYYAEIYKDMVSGDPNWKPDKRDIQNLNEYVDTIHNILMSFGIGGRGDRENIFGLLGMGDRGSEIKEVLGILKGIADKIGSLTDEQAKDYNYMLDTVDSYNRKIWDYFFKGRGFISDITYTQSFYDSATHKTKYSYSADNYLQKTFRELYNTNVDERKAFMDEYFKKYEWFYNHTTNTWRNKWLEVLYNGYSTGGVSGFEELPYKNIDNITEHGNNSKSRSYSEWTEDDIRLVQERSYEGNGGYYSNFYGFYLAPIFADSPMSMTVKGPKLTVDELYKALEDVIDQEMWRIKYVNEIRKPAIERGDIKPIANFDIYDGSPMRGDMFCFIPELNTYMVDGVSFRDRMKAMKDDRATAEEIENFQKAVLEDIFMKKFSEYTTEEFNSDKERDEAFKKYLNMVYANISIIQLTTVDLAYYKDDIDFQKRYKEVYAGGIQLNTNSRYGKKTENVILLSDDLITSPSYDNIASIINGITTLSEADKKYILEQYRNINVADAQAFRSIESYRAVMDMMGNWDENKQEALDRFEAGTWTKGDFDIIFQTIKPFVYTVIDRNDGMGGTIAVPQQHKNSEIALLMMYDLITKNTGFYNSPVYRALSEFMTIKGADGQPLIDMVQFESGGKVGNQGTINISFNSAKVVSAIDNGMVVNTDGKETDLFESLKKKNTVDNAENNYYEIKNILDDALVKKQITQDRYNEEIQSVRFDNKDDIISVLKQKVLIVDDNGNYSINSEVVHIIPFDNYFQAQPTPEHHMDAEATFGSQTRNIIVADLPDNFKLTLNGTNGTKKDYPKDALIDFYYELLNENLIEDYFGEDGLKEIFSSKKNLKKAVEDIVRGNPKYGKDFVDALTLDSDGNFVLSPNSPTMFNLMQELITSMFKNHITKQKIKGAALIQAAGIGLDENLRLRYDDSGKLIGAECYMPLTSKKLFEPFLIEKNGEQYLDVEALKKAKLDKAVGYRIPTENKSSMMPLIIKGFTPQQNGSAIVLPAEVTTMAGSDFDVDKMYIMLPEFKVYEYDMKRARNAYAKQNEQYKRAVDFIKRTGVVTDNTLAEYKISNFDELGFKEWFDKNNNSYKYPTPIVKPVEYDFSKSPKKNGRAARNNMVIQMMHDILTSKTGSESLFNPQGFADVERAAKMTKIMTDETLRSALESQFEGDIEEMTDYLLQSSTKTLKSFIKANSSSDSPIYPQTFAKLHKQNMAGSNQIGIYAVQGSMAAKFQRADIKLRENEKILLNGRTIDRVDASDNGKRLKNVGQMIGASADNGKNPNLTDMGSTDVTAPIIGYMLRLGFSHDEAALIINQPSMKRANYKYGNFSSPQGNAWELHKDNVTSKMLVENILDPEGMLDSEVSAIDWLCYHILRQSESMKDLVRISRADSPNGAMQNSFAKARLQQYNVELFNNRKSQPDYPFTVFGALSNTAVDVSKGEDVVREQLKDQPMAFLHGMYALGINSLSNLASPYFFMLGRQFDESIVKPILYNLDENFYEKEDILDSLYKEYIDYVLSGSTFFGNEDGDSMKSKRDYYLNNFADDYIKVLHENPDINALIGTIITKSGNRVVLKDAGSLEKNQKEDISRRLTALVYGIDANNPNEKAQDLAKDLLLFSYYDSGLNFRHDSYAPRLSTQFLSMFRAYTEALQAADNPLSDELNRKFIQQFFTTHKNAVHDIKDAYGTLNGDRLLVTRDVSRTQRENITNVMLSPKPLSEGVQPYQYVKYMGVVYAINDNESSQNNSSWVYERVPNYSTTENRPLYSMSMSMVEMSEAFPAVISDDSNGSQPENSNQPSQDAPVNPKSDPDTKEENNWYPDPGFDAAQFSEIKEFANIKQSENLPSPKEIVADSEFQNYFDESVTAVLKDKPC